MVTEIYNTQACIFSETRNNHSKSMEQDARPKNDQKVKRANSDLEQAHQSNSNPSKTQKQSSFVPVRLHAPPKSPNLAEWYELTQEEIREFTKEKVERLWSGKCLQDTGEYRISQEMYQTMMEYGLPDEFANLPDPSTPMIALSKDPSEHITLNGETIQIPIELTNSELFHQVFSLDVWKDAFTDEERMHLLHFLPQFNSVEECDDFISWLLSDSHPSPLEPLRQKICCGKFHMDLMRSFQLLQSIEENLFNLKRKVRQNCTIKQIKQYSIN